MDADLVLAGEPSTLKRELEPRLLRPQLAKEQSARAFLYPKVRRALLRPLSPSPLSP
jgi:hypothetical protein